MGRHRDLPSDALLTPRADLTKMGQAVSGHRDGPALLCAIGLKLAADTADPAAGERQGSAPLGPIGGNLTRQAQGPVGLEGCGAPLFGAVQIDLPANLGRAGL